MLTNFETFDDCAIYSASSTTGESQVTLHDTDGNGFWDTGFEARDTNEDGQFDTLYAVQYNDNGEEIFRSTSKDTNGDGILDEATFTEIVQDPGVDPGTGVDPDTGTEQDPGSGSGVPYESATPENWRAYVAAYPDLTNAYVNQKLSGLHDLSLEDWGSQHYVNFGQHEAGRIIPELDTSFNGVSVGEATENHFAAYVSADPELTAAYIESRNNGGHNLSIGEWGQLQFLLEGQHNESWTIPELGELATAEEASTLYSAAHFEAYVNDPNNEDLKDAYNQMAHGAPGPHSETTWVTRWNSQPGYRQITDISDLSEAEWGQIHYLHNGFYEDRQIPSLHGSSPFSEANFAAYVNNNTDLMDAYIRMARGEDSQTTWLDRWNSTPGYRQIDDISELSIAEWGQIHYLYSGFHEGRGIPPDSDQGKIKDRDPNTTGRRPVSNNDQSGGNSSVSSTSEGNVAAPDTTANTGTKSKTDKGSSPDDTTKAPPMEMSPHEAAEILRRDLAIIDRAAGVGGDDNKFSREDLEAVLDDSFAAEDLKEAARVFLDSDIIFDRADSAKDRKHETDTVISENDLDEFIKQTGGKRFEVPTNAADAALILAENFYLLDTAKHGGEADQGASKNDIDALAADNGLPEYIRKAAEFFAGDKGEVLRKALDVAAKGGQTNNDISIGDLRAFAKNNNALRATEAQIAETYDTSTPAGIAAVLSDHYDIFDSANGRGDKDNHVSLDDIKAVRDNPGLPQYIRDAAGALYNSAILRGRVSSDGKISRQEADSWAEREGASSLR